MLRRAAEHAAAAGVRLALEPLNRYEADLVNTAEQGLEFVEEVGHPALGLLLDTYHVNIEEASWEAPFRSLMEAGRLWHVHLGDNNRLPPGRGMIDFCALLRLLRSVGYDGALSAELLAMPGSRHAPRARRSSTCARFWRLLDALELPAGLLLRRDHRRAHAGRGLGPHGTRRSAWTPST